MKVLVVGGAGFIGSSLVEALVELEHQVVVIDDLSNGKLENLEAVKGKIKFLKTDVTRNEWKLNYVCTVPKPDVIYALHCHPRSLSFDDPQKDVRVNVNGMLNLLEFAKETHARVIFASNSGIYGEHSKLPIDETFSDKPSTPYDLNKQVIEEYLKLYHTVYEIPFVIFRFATVYGARQNVTHNWKPVIRHFLSQALADETIEIHGDGNQTRDFIHVSDLVNALVKAIDCEKAVGETMILSTGVETSIGNLYLTICDLLNKTVRHKYGDRRMDDISRMLYSSKKAQQILDWIPKLDLRSGIELMMKKET